jgi:predicted O-methyltransferase YrrM
MADSNTRDGNSHHTQALMQYVQRVHAAHNPGLQSAFDAPGRFDIPAIQLGASESKLLTLLMRLIGAQKVVEVGTLAGYSALRLADGLGEHGKVWTIEYEPQHAEVAEQVIESAGYTDRIEVLTGAGAYVLPTLEDYGPFDAVFVDADKESYPFYGRWAARNIRQGGLLIGDNAYVFGELLDESERGEAMRQFHEEATEYFDTTCIPTPEGMLIGVRK